MNRNYSSTRRYLCGLALGCCTVLMPMHLYAQEASVPPLVTYDQSHPLLAENSEPMVQVFESGAVEVNRPVGNKRAGSYQISISDQQVAQIRQLLAHSSGVEAAVRSVNQEKVIARAVASSGEKTMTLESDPTTTVIAVNPTALAAADGVAPAASGQGVQVLAIDNLADMSGSSNKPSLNAMRELEVMLLGLYDSAGK